MSLKQQGLFLKRKNRSYALVVQALQAEAKLVTYEDPNEHDYWGSTFLILLPDGRYLTDEIRVYRTRWAYSSEDWKQVRDGELATLGVSLAELKTRNGRIKAQTSLVGKVIQLEADLRGVIPGLHIKTGYGDDRHDDIAVPLDQYLKGQTPFKVNS